MIIEAKVLKYLSILMMVLFPFIDKAQIASPLTDTTLNCAVNVDSSYSFIVAGHVYGAFQGSSPAKSFVKVLPKIKMENPLFLALLGDNFKRGSIGEAKSFKKLLTNELGIPTFNAPGNHDIRIKEQYKTYFGEHFSTFIVATELFIFLDTETDPSGVLPQNQLTLIENALAMCIQDSPGPWKFNNIFRMRKKIDTTTINNVFIFSHRHLWATTNKTYGNALFPGLKEEERKTIAKGFSNDITPLLKKVEEIPIFWFSGAIGSNNKFTLFYEKHPDFKNLTVIGTGVRSSASDVVLQVKRDKQANISITPIPLRDKSLEPIESYNAVYWETAKFEPIIIE